MNDPIKKLYLMQLFEIGIPDNIFHYLSSEEQEMLEEKGGRNFLKPEFRKQIKVVLTGGVFDILHIGHVHTLEAAKKLGDVLVVALAKDEHIKNKDRKVIHSQEYRAKMVEFLKPVDIAMLGTDDPMDLVKLVGPDIIVYGYDQEAFLKPESVEIVRLSEHVEEQKFKTSRIIRELGL